MKIVVLLTTIITLNECKPDMLRCKSFCEEGLAIDYEDLFQLSMTYKHLKYLEYFIQLIDYLFQQIEMVSTCKKLGFLCEPDFAENYSGEDSKELKLVSLANKANKQQNDGILKSTAISAQVCMEPDFMNKAS